jgi:pyruvate/2-oxoglutarate dehydrogenase complex dihydrolipoamide acyltransferase (E2) component
MEVRLPELVPDLEFATVVSCRKRAGDTVTAGEILFELEAEKAAWEIEAPISGTLTTVSVAEGDEITVGAILALIDGE